MSKPNYQLFEDSESLRDACQERCAPFGDPPCWALNPEMGRAGGVDVRAEPCAECLSDAGIELPEPLDENAVVRPLL